MHYGDQPWPTIPALLDKVVVLPLGAIEQHGHHLPLATDSLIGTEVMNRTTAMIQGEALVLPMLWIGASDHHKGFPGAASLSAETYACVLCDLLESLIETGFRRIFLLNAHAGNIVPAQSALYKLQLRHYRATPDLWLAFASWFDLAQHQVAACEGIVQESVIHACEWETSLILRSHPHLVVAGERPSTQIAFASSFYTPDFSQSSRVFVARTIDQISATGAFGHPDLASAEKGEAIYMRAATEVAEFIREFAGWPARLMEG